MNISFNQIRKDQIFRYSLIGTGIFVIITVTLIVVLFNKLPPFLPLFNQMPWGVQRLGTKEQFFIPPLITFFTLVINLGVATVIYDKIPLVARILCVTTLLIAIFVLLFTIRTIQIII